jgi:UPF0755 protein
MLSRFIGILIFALSIILTWGWMQYDHFINNPLNLPDEGITYHLKQGSSLRQLASSLAQQKIIEHEFMLKLLARQTRQDNRLKAGEYHIPAGTTPTQLLHILTSGKVVQHPITLVEGWTFNQMLAAIKRHPFLKQSLEVDNQKEVMQLIGYPEQHPEGRFYPDTYHFPRGSTDLDFLKRAFHKMEKFIASEWEKRAEDLPLKTPYEALILASIVEKETGLAAERAKISGVFIRRLKRGMKLQTDPTVIYGMGDSYQGNIRRKDLTTDTPYNTYVHRGLPPTPIAMPSGAAIRAALHPEDGDELYFVATGDGGHYFSATLEEHNRAVRKYQLKK